MNDRARTLVIAFGNPLRGDDGAAAAVLDLLAQSCCLPHDVALVDAGTACLESLLLWQGCQNVILIDCADMGKAPGTWGLVDVNVLIENPDTMSLHSAGVADALALGSAMDILPATVILYGIQPAQVNWKPGLSEAVQRELPGLSSAILDTLRGLCGPEE